MNASTRFAIPIAILLWSCADVRSEAPSGGGREPAGDSKRTEDEIVTPGGCPILDRGACRAVEARDATTLFAAGAHMPGATFALSNGRFVAFAPDYVRGAILGTASSDLRAFSPPLSSDFAIGGDVTGASSGGERALFFVGAVGTFRRSAVRPDGSLEPPTDVAIDGTSVLPYWPQATGLDDGRTLLAFVEAQTRAFLAVGDGVRFATKPSPVPLSSVPMRGVLAHVGTTTEGAWVFAHQVADARWSFRSFVQLSRDEGATWSAPIQLRPSQEDVHDAYPLRRKSGGADVYYLRASEPGAFNVHRRALAEDGRLGPEQVVTAPAVGHIEKPQPRRLPDGRIALAFAVRRSVEDFVYHCKRPATDGDARRSGVDLPQMTLSAPSASTLRRSTGRASGC
jgi:hypothetical protein